MLRSDVQLFGSQLNALAETFDKKPVSVKAMEVWFDTLKDFPTERVMDVVNHWAKAHGKFPTPAEVWREVNERSVAERERKAESDRAEIQGEYRSMGRTAQGSKIIAEMRAILAKPKRSMVDHWRYVLEHGNETGKQYASEALLKLAPVKREPEREPGQDDEEADYYRNAPMLNL